MAEPPKPAHERRTRWEILVILGAIALGAFLAFQWSSRQQHQLGNVRLKGDHRGIVVLGHAILGGAGAGLVAGIGCWIVLARARKRRDEGR